jgi:hypothetical protein
LAKEQFKKPRLDCLIVPNTEDAPTQKPCVKAGDKSEQPARGPSAKAQAPLYSNNCPMVKEGNEDYESEEESEDDHRPTAGLFKSISAKLKKGSKESPPASKKSSGRFDQYGRPIDPSPPASKKSSGRFEKGGSARFDKYGRPIDPDKFSGRFTASGQPYKKDSGRSRPR